MVVRKRSTPLNPNQRFNQSINPLNPQDASSTWMGRTSPIFERASCLSAGQLTHPQLVFVVRALAGRGADISRSAVALPMPVSPGRSKR